MPFRNPPDDAIRAILVAPKTVAVVGCSPDPHRDSNRIARFLQAKGHRIIPVNPRVNQILGRRCYATLGDVPERIDMVDVFRRSEHVAEIAEEAIAAGAKILWTQLDVVDEAAAARAEAAGLVVVMNRCPAIEYRRLGL